MARESKAKIHVAISALGALGAGLLGLLYYVVVYTIAILSILLRNVFLPYTTAKKETVGPGASSENGKRTCKTI